MARFRFDRFGGSVPRLVPHLIGEAAAAEALDCKFWHGTLQSWREPLLIREAAEDTSTIYQHACCWLDFPACVDIAEGPPNCHRLYTTGDQDWPAVVSIDVSTCEVAVQRLGIPCPEGVLSVVPGALNDSAEKDTEGRSYAYQYVNNFGEASSLSAGSQVQMVRDGQTVLVSGWIAPSAEWGVTTVRIYRTVSGFQSGLEDANTLDTAWMLVAEIPVTDAAYTDTLYNEELDTAIEEDIVEPPPAGMRGITAVPGMNSLAGFMGNKVYFTVNNSYHNWRDVVQLDHNVCAIVESNGALYVATDGVPYVIGAKVPCDEGSCREVIQLGDKAVPMVGCGNRRMASLNVGAVYPSHNGLFMLNGRNAPVNLTSALYAPDDWQMLMPGTVHPVAHDGLLYVFGQGGSFALKQPGSEDAGWTYDSHTSLSDTDVTDAYVSRTGDFYLLKDGSVYQWDRGLQLRPHRWVSREVISVPPIPLGAGVLHLSGGAENVMLAADGREVLSRQVMYSRAFTLPRWANGERWQVTLSGTATVSFASFASNMKGL